MSRYKAPGAEGYRARLLRGEEKASSLLRVGTALLVFIVAVLAGVALGVGTGALLGEPTAPGWSVVCVFPGNPRPLFRSVIATEPDLTPNEERVVLYLDNGGELNLPASICQWSKQVPTDWQ